jgi:hypothetical protein
VVHLISPIPEQAGLRWDVYSLPRDVCCAESFVSAEKRALSRPGYDHPLKHTKGLELRLVFVQFRVISWIVPDFSAGLLELSDRYRSHQHFFLLKRSLQIPAIL